MSYALAATIWWTLRLGALLLVQIPWLRLLGPLWIPIAGVLALSIASALVLALAVTAAPLAGLSTLDMSSAIEPSTLLRGAVLEVIFGGLVGFVVGLPGHALLGAANASGRALGLRRGTTWEPLLITLVLSLALGVNLHRPLLLGLREFALLAPPGLGHGQLGTIAHLSSGLSAATLAAGAAHLLFLALALATPVLLARAVVELAASLVEPPGEPRSGLGPWLAAAAAVLALCASWAAYPDAWLRSLEPAVISLGAG